MRAVTAKARAQQTALVQQFNESVMDAYMESMGSKSPRRSYHALRESYAAGKISLGAFESQVEGLLRAGL